VAVGGALAGAADDRDRGAIGKRSTTPWNTPTGIHARAGSRSIAVESTDEKQVGCVVVVTDFGCWRKGQPRRDRGNGLALIKAMVGWLHVDSDEAGTRVAMRSAAVPSTAAVGTGLTYNHLVAL
jgi:hypothetical protein